MGSEGIWNSLRIGNAHNALGLVFRPFHSFSQALSIFRKHGHWQNLAKLAQLPEVSVAKASAQLAVLRSTDHWQSLAEPGDVHRGIRACQRLSLLAMSSHMSMSGWPDIKFEFVFVILCAAPRDFPLQCQIAAAATFCSCIVPDTYLNFATARIHELCRRKFARCSCTLA